MLQLLIPNPGALIPLLSEGDMRRLEECKGSIGVDVAGNSVGDNDNDEVGDVDKGEKVEVGEEMREVVNVFEEANGDGSDDSEDGGDGDCVVTDDINGLTTEDGKVIDRGRLRGSDICADGDSDDAVAGGYKREVCIGKGTELVGLKD